jgi:hypothetical protein
MVTLISEIGIMLYVNNSRDAVVAVKDMTSNCQHCLVCKWGRQSRKPLTLNQGPGALNRVWRIPTASTVRLGKTFIKQKL